MSSSSAIVDGTVGCAGVIERCQEDGQETVFVPSSFLWNDRLLCFNDLEGTHGRHWFRVTHCCSTFRQHGAGLPERRSSIPHKLRRGRYQGWRDRRVQDRRKRHSYSAQSTQTTRERRRIYQVWMTAVCMLLDNFGWIART